MEQFNLSGFSKMRHRTGSNMVIYPAWEMQGILANVHQMILRSSTNEHPNGQYHFSSSKGRYIIDFNLMIQTNQKTNVVKKVKRIAKE